MIVPWADSVKNWQGRGKVKSEKSKVKNPVPSDFFDFLLLNFESAVVTGGNIKESEFLTSNLKP
jgi:hypothetical protein